MWKGGEVTRTHVSHLSHSESFRFRTLRASTDSLSIHFVFAGSVRLFDIEWLGELQSQAKIEMHCVRVGNPSG